jgi:hypothetical protein
MWEIAFPKTAHGGKLQVKQGGTTEEVFWTGSEPTCSQMKSIIGEFISGSKGCETKHTTKVAKYEVKFNSWHDGNRTIPYMKAHAKHETNNTYSGVDT